MSELEDGFLVGRDAFDLIKRQLNVSDINGEVKKLEYNGFVMRLDTAQPPNVVAGVGPVCSKIAKKISEMIEAGEF